jgi:hypothetical protein
MVFVTYVSIFRHEPLNAVLMSDSMTSGRPREHENDYKGPKLVVDL